MQNVSKYMLVLAVCLVTFVEVSKLDIMRHFFVHDDNKYLMNLALVRYLLGFQLVLHVYRVKSEVINYLLSFYCYSDSKAVFVSDGTL